MMKFQRTYFIDLPTDTVYSGWTSEDSIVPPATKLVIEPDSGGIYRLTTSDGATMEGKFLEVEQNKHLMYTWQWLGSDEATQVEVSFRTYSGGTELEIIHSGFDSEDSMRRYAEGWDSYIAGLTKLLEKGA